MVIGCQRRLSLYGSNSDNQTRNWLGIFPSEAGSLCCLRTLEQSNKTSASHIPKMIHTQEAIWRALRSSLLTTCDSLSTNSMALPILVSFHWRFFFHQVIMTMQSRTQLTLKPKYPDRYTGYSTNTALPKYMSSSISNRLTAEGLSFSSLPAWFDSPSGSRASSLGYA